MSEIAIREGYIPGSIGRVVQLHGSYYHENWHFGVFFEAKVATELSAFISRYNSERDGFWLAVSEKAIEGAVAIDGADGFEQGAHLRWYIVSDAHRNRGVGKRLLNKAVGFCTEKGYHRIYLWTFDGLHAARHLYEKAGFRLAEQHDGRGWGTTVTEQRFELLIHPSA